MTHNSIAANKCGFNFCNEIPRPMQSDRCQLISDVSTAIVQGVSSKCLPKEVNIATPVTMTGGNACFTCTLTISN